MTSSQALAEMEGRVSDLETKNKKDNEAHASAMGTIMRAAVGGMESFEEKKAFLNKTAKGDASLASLAKAMMDEEEKKDAKANEDKEKEAHANEDKDKEAKANEDKEKEAKGNDDEKKDATATAIAALTAKLDKYEKQATASVNKQVVDVYGALGSDTSKISSFYATATAAQINEFNTRIAPLYAAAKAQAGITTIMPAGTPVASADTVTPAIGIPTPDMTGVYGSNEDSAFALASLNIDNDYVSMEMLN